MKNKIKELIKILNKASDDYYNGRASNMTDLEWDREYDKLLLIEEETGILYSNSPTQNVGYEIVKGLEVVKHNIPLLSLDKSKEVSDIIKFKNKGECLFGDKLDGLTIKLTYIDGKLEEGSTRGDGEAGYDVTHNIKHIKNIPQTIAYKEKLVLVGECVSSYDNFNKLNEDLINNGQDVFTHPRMLASGSMKQLDSEVFKKRGLEFIVFAVIEGYEENDSKHYTFLEVNELGFDIWEYWCVSPIDSNIQKMVTFKENEEHKNPLDGMVITYDSKTYSKSLGRGEKFPHHSRALKWEDETYQTTTTDVIVDVGRTGQVSFKAQFDMVEIDGSEVTNATLHNPTRVNELGIGIGAIITVYKAGKIIPQVDKVIVLPKEKYVFDYKCPFCGHDVQYKILLTGEQSENVFCVNENCSRVKMKQIAHFVGKSAMDIEGMSEKTIEAIMNTKIDDILDFCLLENIMDLYELYKCRDQLLTIPRFGVKKVDKLLFAIEESKKQPLNRLLCGLGIPNIGEGTSKKLANKVGDLRSLSDYIVRILNHPECKIGDWDTLTQIIGERAMDSLYDNREIIYDWCDYFFDEMGINPSMELKETTSNKFEGLSFVVTGSVDQFKNRKELQSHIENLGGKIQSGVSSTTNYLINNDSESKSSKNVKANKLGVKIISEIQYLALTK